MRRLRTISIYTAGTLISAVVFRFIEYPDSFFACLSVALAVDIIASMLRMCDRLLDPPPAIFLIFGHHGNNSGRLLHMP